MPFFKLMYNFKLHGFNKKSIICIFANLLQKNNSHNSFQAT